VAIDPPEVDGRSRAELLEDMQRIASYYTDEWSAGTGDVGSALFELFAEITAEVTDRLDHVPEKHRVSFFHELGFERYPPQPARLPLTFTVADGAPANVSIPTGTQATAPAKGARPEQTFTVAAADTFEATPATLANVYSVDRQRDRIVDHWNPDEGLIDPTLFEGTNAQEHILYIGHEELLTLSPGGTIQIELTSTASETTLWNDLRWEYYGEDPSKSKAEAEGWHKFKDPSTTTAQSDETVRIALSLPTDGTVMEKMVDGTKSKWIRARIPTAADPEWTDIQDTASGAPREDLFGLSIDTIHMVAGLGTGVKPLPPDEMRHNDVPIPVADSDGPSDGLYPLGKLPRQLDTFFLACDEAFSKKTTQPEQSATNPSPKTTIKLQFNPVKEGGAKETPMVRVPPQTSNGSSIFVEVATAETEGKVTILGPDDLQKGESGTIPSNSHQCVEVGISDVDSGSEVKLTAKLRLVGKTVDSSETIAIDTGWTGPVLSWEYWNGTGWDGIPSLTDRTSRLRGPGVVEFSVPGDFEPTGVAGHDGYWVRARLVDGDYGQIKYTENHDTWTQDTSGVHPPHFKNVDVHYTVREPPTNLVPYNNREYGVDRGGRLPPSLVPFSRPQEESQTVYLGFDQSLNNGPIQLLFGMQEVEYEEDFFPRLRWEYCVDPASDGWQTADVHDETEGLTRRGIVGLTFSESTTPCSRFENELHWIRARVRGTSFERPTASGTAQGGTPTTPEAEPPTPASTPTTGNVTGCGCDGNDEEESDECDCESCSSPGLPRPCGVMVETEPITGVPGRPFPRLTGIHPNTGWAANTVAIDGEIIGSSDSRLAQSFVVRTPPVLSETVWVDELATLAEGERTALKETRPAFIDEVTDDRGEVTAFWVAWERVDDFLASDVDDRHYTVDRATGQVTFADGINGAIPPRGLDNIRIDYTTGGGAAGNVPPNTVTDLKSSVAFVDEVSNPLAGDGGAPAESTAAVLRRAPKQLRDRNRAVAEEDFERLALAASRQLARARCISGMDKEGTYTPGWVTVLIVPNSQQDKPVASVELKERVTDALTEHAPAPVVRSDPPKLVVRGPSYVAVSIQTKVAASSVGSISAVEEAVNDAVTAFLHPLFGGETGDGWNFGTLPCLSDMYAVIEQVSGVDHVEELSMVFRGSTGKVTVTEGDDSPSVSIDALVQSGTHEINATGEL
jgi:uncharacterized phage protein gp47/JayE